MTTFSKAGSKSPSLKRNNSRLFVSLLALFAAAICAALSLKSILLLSVVELLSVAAILGLLSNSIKTDAIISSFKSSKRLFAAMLLAALDVPYLASGVTRYLPLSALVLPWLIETRTGMRNMRAGLLANGRVALTLTSILSTWGITGSLIGIMFRNSNQPFLSTWSWLFASSIGCLLILRNKLRMDEKVILKTIALAGLIYTILACLTNLSLVPLPRGDFLHNETAMLLTAPFASYALKWRTGVLLGVVGFLVCFASYPAGTYLIGAVVACATYFLLGRPWSGMRKRACIYACFGLFTALSLKVGSGTQLGAEYFQYVSKGNNNETRSLLWKEATKQFYEHPLFGSLFTGNTTVEVPKSAIAHLRIVEPHSDYMIIALGGGAVALILYLLWIIHLNLTFISASANRTHESHAGLKAIAALMNCFFAVGALAGTFALGALGLGAAPAFATAKSHPVTTKQAVAKTHAIAARYDGKASTQVITVKRASSTLSISKGQVHYVNSNVKRITASFRCNDHDGNHGHTPHVDASSHNGHHGLHHGWTKGHHYGWEKHGKGHKGKGRG